MILAKTRKLICTQIYHHFLSEYYNTQLMNTSLGNYDYIENCIGLYCKGYYLCNFDYIMFTAIALRFLVADVGEPTRRWLLEMTT